MTPQERLKEIEAILESFSRLTDPHLNTKEFLQITDECEWLINRVKRLTEALEFYTDRKNFTLIFDDEFTTRAEVYERYQKNSIGDFSITARKALSENTLEDEK